MSSKQIIYKLKSTEPVAADSREVEIRGFVVQQDSIALVGPPIYNAKYKLQPIADQNINLNISQTLTEAAITALASAGGYALYKVIDGVQTTVLAALAVPGTLSIAQAGEEDSETIVLTTAASGNFFVYKSTEGQANFQKIAEISADDEYVDTDVVVGMTYYYKVRRANLTTDQVSANSNIVSHTVVTGS